MIMAQPFGNGPDGTQWVKTGIPVGFQTYTGGKRPRAQPFGNGPDGTQWVETGIPVGFQTYVDGPILGGPSPYPFFIKSQQDECPNLPKSYKLFESVCVRSDINVIPTVLGKINLIPIDAPRLTTMPINNGGEIEPGTVIGGTNPQTVGRANSSFSVLRGMTINVEQGVENTDQKIDSIIVLLDDMQQILTTISGDNTMEGGTKMRPRSVSDSKAQKLKAQRKKTKNLKAQQDQPQTDDNANNHFTDLNQGLTNVNGIIAKTNPKIDSIIVRLDDMEQKLARIPNGKNGNSGNNGNNGNNGNSGNNGNIEGGGHRRYTSRMKKRVKSRRNR